MKKLMLFVFLVVFLSGCNFIPQRRAMYSSHKGKGGVLSYSYPAELREANIFWEYNNLNPLPYQSEEVKKLYSQISENIRIVLTEKQESKKLEARKKLDTLYEQLASVLPKSRRIAILAAPPPDISVTQKGINISVKGEKALEGITASIEGLLAQAAQGIEKSTESDVKRQLAYRLNEALINFPEFILPVYAELFKAIVNKAHIDANKENKK